MNETFIGGFTSGFLARGFLGTRVGYGLYFTSVRLFGVDPANFSGGSLGGSTGGLIEGQLMPILNPEQTLVAIAELERAKDFELARADIKTIEIKQPGWLGLGRMTINTNDGKTITLVLRNRIAYQRLGQLILAQGTSARNP